MQGQQNLSATRIVDPILSEIARGYSSPKSPIANLLFPVVDVKARAGQILNFGPDDFKLVSTVRAPGANTKRVQFGYLADKFALFDYRLEGAVPRENEEEAVAAQLPGIDLATMAIRRVQNMMALEREAQAADLANDPNKYSSTNVEALSSTAMWDNEASDPVDDIEEAKEIIRAQTGETPNVLALGPRVLSKLRRHPKLMDRISTSKDRVPLSTAQLAALFELEQVVAGGAVKHDGAKFVDIWGTSAVLAYTTPKSAQEQGSPSFGYTYRLQGRPVVEEPYFDNNTVTWYYPTSDAYQAALVGKAAGFLFRNTVAPSA